MKSRYQKAAMAFAFIALLAVVDGLVKGVRDPRDTFRVVAGGETFVNGKLDLTLDMDGIKSHSEVSRADDPKLLNDYLRYVASSPEIQIEFLELQGSLWRGVVRAPRSTPGGEITFQAYAKGQPPGEKTPRSTLRVFDSEERLRADQPSLVLRYLGMEPWWVLAGSLPLAVLFGFLVFRAQSDEEDQLIARGVAPIYKLAKRKEGWEILFGLGARQGVRVGDELCVLAPDGRAVGALKTTKVGPNSSHATLDLAMEIGPDYFVARPDSHMATSARTSPVRN